MDAIETDAEKQVARQLRMQMVGQLIPICMPTFTVEEVIMEADKLVKYIMEGKEEKV